MWNINRTITIKKETQHFHFSKEKLILIHFLLMMQYTIGALRIFNLIP